MSQIQLQRLARRYVGTLLRLWELYENYYGTNGNITNFKGRYMEMSTDD